MALVNLSGSQSKTSRHECTREICEVGGWIARRQKGSVRKVYVGEAVGQSICTKNQDTTAQSKGRKISQSELTHSDRDARIRR